MKFWASFNVEGVMLVIALALAVRLYLRRRETGFLFLALAVAVLVLARAAGAAAVHFTAAGTVQVGFFAALGLLRIVWAGLLVAALVILADARARAPQPVQVPPLPPARPPS